VETVQHSAENQKSWLSQFSPKSGDSESRDSSVGIAMGCGLDGLGSIPDSARFVSSTQRPGRL
jgi:hypothetical protein